MWFGYFDVKLAGNMQKKLFFFKLDVHKTSAVLVLIEYQITELVLHIWKSYKEYNVVLLLWRQAGVHRQKKFVFSSSLI